MRPYDLWISVKGLIIFCIYWLRTGWPEVFLSSIHNRFFLIGNKIEEIVIFYAEDLNFVKTKTKDIALSCFRIYNNNVPQHLSKGEIDALSQIYLKTGKLSLKKGNSKVIVDRHVC